MRTSTLLTLVLAAPLSAQQWSDDFNRADSGSMGVDWTETAGDYSISGQMGREESGGISKMTHNSANMPYTDAVISIRAEPIVGTFAFVGAVMGDGGSRNLYTKLQDNDADGLYDRIFFYSTDNGTGYGPNYYQDLPTPVTEATFTVYVTGSGDVMNADVDFDHDGTVDYHFENAGILGFASSLGTGFAIAAWSNALFDDWVGGSGQTLLGTPDSISLATGGSQVLSMDVGAAEAFKTYQIVGSVSGTVPGITFTGTNLPLNFDAYLNYTFLNPNTPLLNASAGTLNSLGQATAVFTLPPASDPAFAGLPLNHAGFVIEVVSGSIQMTIATNAAPCQLIP